MNIANDEFFKEWRVVTLLVSPPLFRAERGDGSNYQQSPNFQTKEKAEQYIVEIKKAEAAISDVAKWLEKQIANDFEYWSEYCAEPAAASVARLFCLTLLTASKADGLGGCKLCGS